MDDAPRISVSSRSAAVRVTARDGASVGAVHATCRDEADGSIVVQAAPGPTRSIELTCPTGSHLTIGTASGRIELSGLLGSVRIVTGSGRVDIDQASGLDVRTSSGRVEVHRCEGDCRIVTKSGRVHVEHARGVEISTASGRIEADEVEHAAVTSVSGRVEVGLSTATPVARIRTVSGPVGVELAEAVAPDVALTSVTGRVRCECEEGTDGLVTVETTSGSIRVRHR